MPLSDRMQRTQARDDWTVARKLDRSSRGVGDRLIVTAVQAAESHFQEWAVIRSWVHEIAATLQSEQPVDELPVVDPRRQALDEDL
jgi:hypothetical protein